MVSITRPSRGERWSATTTRHSGSFLPPTRVSLSLTDMFPFWRTGCARQLSGARPARPRGGVECSAGAAHERREVGHPAAPDLAHQRTHLGELLEQAADLLNARARAARDTQPPRALDQLRASALVRRHRADDRL